MFTIGSLAGLISSVQWRYCHYLFTGLPVQVTIMPHIIVLLVLVKLIIFDFKILIL